MDIDSCAFPCIDASEKQLSLRSSINKKKTRRNQQRHRDVNVCCVNISERAANNGTQDAIESNQKRRMPFAFCT